MSKLDREKLFKSDSFSKEMGFEMPLEIFEELDNLKESRDYFKIKRSLFNSRLRNLFELNDSFKNEFKEYNRIFFFKSSSKEEIKRIYSFFSDFMSNIEMYLYLEDNIGENGSANLNKTLLKSKIEETKEEFLLSEIETVDAIRKQLDAMSRRIFSRMYNFIPFGILAIDEFSLCPKSKDKFISERLPKIQKYSISKVIKDENVKQKLLENLDLAGSLPNDKSANIMSLVKATACLQKTYGNLSTYYKSKIINYYHFVIWIQSKSGFSFGPGTINDSFWKDFLDFKEGAFSNREKAINEFNEHPLFQKWFIDVWKGQKDIPKSAQEVLDEILSLKEHKEKIKASNKKVTDNTNNVKKDVSNATKEEKENILYESPTVKKIDENPANFKYEIQKPGEKFILQMQIGKNLPVEINGGEIDMKENASKNKKIVAKFRFWKNKKEDHETFEWIPIELAKLPKEYKNSNETSNVAEKVDQIIKGKPTLDNKKPPVKKEEERTEIPEDVLSVWIDLFREEEKVEQIFAGFPDEIISNNFNICFSDDFAEFCRLKSINIKINIEEKSIEFTSLKGNENDIKFLKEAIWELLDDKITDWRNLQIEALKIEEQKNNLKILSARQKEFNAWLNDLNKTIHSYNFFESSRKLEELFSMDEKKLKKEEISSLEVLEEYTLTIAGTHKKESREILKKFESVGFTEIDIKPENRMPTISGKIKISKERFHEFKASWDKEKKEVVLSIDGSDNFVKKIKELFRKIFLKIIWDVLSEKEVGRMPFFAEFEKYKDEKDVDKFNEFWGDNEEKKEKNKASYISKFERKEMKGIDVNGNFVKGCGWEHLKDPNIVLFVLMDDKIRSNRDNGSEDIIKYDEKKISELKDSFFSEVGNEKYCIYGLKNTLENYKKFGNDFIKYKANGWTPFYNQDILNLLLKEILPRFGISVENFISKLTADDINSLIDEEEFSKPKKEKSVIDFFLEKIEEYKIPLIYASAHTIKSKTLRKLLVK